MSALLRARLSSFLAGVAVAGVVGVYQLRVDLQESQKALAEQVGAGRSRLVAAAEIVYSGGHVRSCAQMHAF